MAVSVYEPGKLRAKFMAFETGDMKMKLKLQAKVMFSEKRSASPLAFSFASS